MIKIPVIMGKYVMFLGDLGEKDELESSGRVRDGQSGPGPAGTGTGKRQGSGPGRDRDRDRDETGIGTGTTPGPKFVSEQDRDLKFFLAGTRTGAKND
jgi:hypothetical protein